MGYKINKSQDLIEEELKKKLTNLGIEILEPNNKENKK